MAAAILRVKRKHSEAPQEAFYIACKRQKNEAEACESEDTLSTVLKFMGTVDNQEEDAVQHIKTFKCLSKDELKETFKKPDILNHRVQARLQAKQKSAENRYKFINSSRCLGEEKDESFSKEVTTIIDVEDAGLDCTDAKSNIEESDYVYDLYYTRDHFDGEISDSILIRPMEDQLVFDGHGNSDSDANCADSDSNSESNWRNDYPDTDHSVNSVTDDDMIEAVGKLKVSGEESDLSSDEEDFAYGLDENDVEKYGHRYAKSRAKMDKESDDDSESGDYFVSDEEISKSDSSENDEDDD